jgi:hypothetical protein
MTVPEPPRAVAQDRTTRQQRQPSRQRRQGPSTTEQILIDVLDAIFGNRR